MRCETNKSGGGTVILCYRGHRRKNCACCPSLATHLCDFKLKGAKSGKTCDMPLCSRHSVSVGKDRDLCPAHDRLLKSSRAPLYDAVADTRETPPTQFTLPGMKR